MSPVRAPGLPKQAPATSRTSEPPSIDVPDVGRRAAGLAYRPRTRISSEPARCAVVKSTPLRWAWNGIRTRDFVGSAGKESDGMVAAADALGLARRYRNGGTCGATSSASAWPSQRLTPFLDIRRGCIRWLASSAHRTISGGHRRVRTGRPLRDRRRRAPRRQTLSDRSVPSNITVHQKHRRPIRHRLPSAYR